MAAFSNYLEDELLNHVLRGITYDPPSSFYIGLVGNYSSGELESGIFSGELAGNGYDREAVSAGTGTWSVPSNNTSHNLSAIYFQRAIGSWGEVSGVFVADADSSGNVLFHGLLSSSVTINNAARFYFPSGSLQITLN